MTTRNQIRLKIFDLYPKLGTATQDGITALQATDGAALTLVDRNNALPTGAAQNLFKNQFLNRPTAASPLDVRRIITTFDGAASEYTHAGPVWTNNPVVTDPYLICLHDPDHWTRAINSALLTRLFFIRRTDAWTPVSNTRRLYTDLTAAPISITDIDRAGRIVNVQRHNPTELTDEERWKDWADGNRKWEAFDEAGVVQIKFDFPGRPPTAQEEIRFVLALPFTTLGDEDAADVLVDVEWAAHASVLEMARMWGHPTNPKDPLIEAAARARPAYDTIRAMELQRYSGPIVSNPARRVGGFRV